MSNSVPTLAFGVELTGDLSVETWPAYLTDSQYEIVALAAICACDFRVKRHDRSYKGDRFVRFTVGELHRSRQMALHLDDPRGVVYILEDNGEIWHSSDLMAPPATKATKAITIGALTSDTYLSVVEHLELDAHKNARLAV